MIPRKGKAKNSASPTRSYNSSRSRREMMQRLLDLGREFSEVFAWGPDNMPGVDPDFALHRLHVDPSFRPTKKKKMNFSDEKNLALQKELGDLIKSYAIRQLQFPE
ncbi:hypothetical protein LIER_16278 [Lithospermum erythrorhizon]|uniref:Uncharacterized protein n=1 Tax=Lithospermum erythrorhizon TaxID=34254 RepID=A0AAV3Q630_LITER